jgi:hypothetical protein
MVAEVDDHGVYRVRLHQTKQRKGYVNGEPFTQTTTTYLDGRQISICTAGPSYQKEDMSSAAIPTRTKDVTDFGRLTQAAQALAQTMGRFTADNPPSADQLESLIRSYQNLLEWRRKARESMSRAEGEIDAVQGMLTQFL